jgi:hypothetical protein
MSSKTESSETMSSESVSSETMSSENVSSETQSNESEYNESEYNESEYNETEYNETEYNETEYNETDSNEPGSNEPGSNEPGSNETMKPKIELRDIRILYTITSVYIINCLLGIISSILITFGCGCFILGYILLLCYIRLETVRTYTSVEIDFSIITRFISYNIQYILDTINKGLNENMIAYVNIKQENDHSNHVDKDTDNYDDLPDLIPCTDVNDETNGIPDLIPSTLLNNIKLLESVLLTDNNLPDSSSCIVNSNTTCIHDIIDNDIEDVTEQHIEQQKANKEVIDLTNTDDEKK